MSGFIILFDESRSARNPVSTWFHKLGVFGIADVIEFQPTLPAPKGVPSGKGGLWQPTPVEYKRVTLNRMIGIWYSHVPRLFVWKKCWTR